MNQSVFSIHTLTASLCFQHFMVGQQLASDMEVSCIHPKSDTEAQLCLRCGVRQWMNKRQAVKWWTEGSVLVKDGDQGRP